MPTVTVENRKLFAHCRNPMCPGYKQSEVDGLVQETGWRFDENGGDIPGIERSFVSLNFADQDDAPCGSCGDRRELSLDSRPSYEPLSGFDPMGLLREPKFDPNHVNTVEDAKVAELEAKNKALEAKLDAILEKLGDGSG